MDVQELVITSCEIPRGMRLTLQAEKALREMFAHNVCQVERDDSAEGFQTFQQLAEIAGVDGFTWIVENNGYIGYLISDTAPTA